MGKKFVTRQEQMFQKWQERMAKNEKPPDYDEFYKKCPKGGVHVFENVSCGGHFLYDVVCKKCSWVKKTIPVRTSGGIKNTRGCQYKVAYDECGRPVTIQARVRR